MFGVPVELKPKAKPGATSTGRGGETVSAFHSEVRRRRLEREGRKS
jgi:hypothetical protein